MCAEPRMSQVENVADADVSLVPLEEAYIQLFLGKADCTVNTLLLIVTELLEEKGIINLSL